MSSVLRVLPVSADGKKPASTTVKDWMITRGWIERADALDAEVSRALDEEAIQERAAQLKEMAKVGKEIMDKGKKHILENDFDSSAAAVRAVGLGSDMVFRFSAAADYLAKIGSMSNKQLDVEVRKLLGKNEEGMEILDGEINEGLEEMEEDVSEDNLA